MNSRERILAAINHEPVDRVPTDIWATPEVWEKLKERFGDDEDVYSALNIDGMAYFSDADYVGPDLGECAENETVNYWQFRFRKTFHGSGCYDEQFYYPLAEMETIDDLKEHQWPQTDWFEYASLKEKIKKVYNKRAVLAGLMAPFYYHNMLRGLEKSLMDPLLNPEYTHYLLDRLTVFFCEHHRKMFEACDGMIDITQVTDDFGTQHGPMISMNVFREFYKPRLKKMIDLAKEFGIKVFHHDDGAIRNFISDLIEIGIDILNPVQWSCPGMELKGLKKDFGNNLCFHGGVDNQNIIPFGTTGQVRKEVRHNIDNLISDHKGYILAPCHSIQPNTPVENIIAMYDEAYNYGRF